MPINVPDNPKVYTTKYDNFKGVDFTNDETNIWHRRSPTGTNMLPDASGRPFKRHGWEIMITNEELCTELGTDNCSILKCAYFELAGKDHIVIFTNQGVLFYNQTDGFTALSVDEDCYYGFDRCFFFEGNGTSAFYIYGNFKVWRYSYAEDVGFTFEDVNDFTVPTVLIAASADCAGQMYQGYNILGNLARVEYCDTDLFASWGTDGLVYSLDKATYISGKTKNHTQLYTYNNGWSPSLPSSITTSSQPKNGDQIYVVYANGVLLPNSFNIVEQFDLVKVWRSSATQFDYLMTTIDAGTPSTNQCLLIADPVSRERKQALVLFNASQSLKPVVAGEDYIRVEFPVSETTITTIDITDEQTITGTAELVGEVVG